MADLFWLSDEQRAVIEPVMPRNQPGPKRNDDRQVIGLPARPHLRLPLSQLPGEYGPRTPVYNRFNSWSRRGFWKARLSELARVGWAGDAAAFDGSFVIARRSAFGGEGGGESAGYRPVKGRPETKIHGTHRCPRPARRPPADAQQRQRRDDLPAALVEAPGRIRRPSADEGYDADGLRADLRIRAITPIISGKRGRKR